MCRRYGVLWADYPDAAVEPRADPEVVDRYAWGERSQDFIRCKTCGCVMQWKKRSIGPKRRTGVNARNFDPSALGAVRILLLDGARTWKTV